MSSVISGAFFYVGWMALFILITPYSSSLVRGVLWGIAPIITASGFFCGAALFIRIKSLPQPPSRRLLSYPLVGCIVGAAIVFPFGPMLIVFGMCFLGSISMLWYEVHEWRRLAATETIAPHDCRKEGC